MAQLSKARQRGLYPERMPIGYAGGPRVEVAISMDKAAYDWLAGFAAQPGYLTSVEQALNAAVSAMKGEAPLGAFAEGLAGQHGMRASELLFRPCAAGHDAVDRLYLAARFAAEVSRGGLLSLVMHDELPEPAIIALAQAALGDSLDIEAEIARARQQAEEIEAEDRAEAEAELRRREPGGEPDRDEQSDEDIPF